MGSNTDSLITGIRLSTEVTETHQILGVLREAVVEIELTPLGI